MTQRIVDTEVLAVYFLSDVRNKFQLIVSIDVTGLDTAAKARGRATDAVWEIIGLAQC